MNGVDILILIILISGGILGAIIGLYRAFVGITSIIIAIICASRFYIPLAKLLEDIPISLGIIKICSFTLIFVVTYLVVTIFGILGYRLITAFSLGKIDKIGGMVLGIIGGLFFASICVILLTKYPFANSPQLFAESKLVPLCLSTIKLLLKLLPEEFSSILHQLEAGMVSLP